MFRFFLSWAVTVALVVVPAFAELDKTETPAGLISWSDDFLRAAPESSNFVTHVNYCIYETESRPRYTAIGPDIVAISLHYADVAIGGGRLLCSNDVVGRPGFGGGAVSFAVLGWLNYIGMCAGDDPVAQGAIDTEFDDDDLCMYAGFEFARWHLRDGEGGLGSADNANGPDNAPGYAGMDDDRDGQTDDDADELFGNVLNNVPGHIDPYGADGAPGVVNVDDDGNGVTDDDLNERGFGDDADDNQGRGELLFLMRGNTVGGTAMYLGVDPGDETGALFSLGHFSAGFFTQTVIEAGDEIGEDFFLPGVRYNFAWCAASSCYGAQLWIGKDRGNPIETLGPVIQSGVTGVEVALGAQMTGVGSDSLMEQWIIRGNQSYRDRFWVLEGDLMPLVPADRDADADVDGVDFAAFAQCYNKAGNPPRTLGCDSDDVAAFDADSDGDVDGFDFSVFASCFNKAGNPPRRSGCIRNLTMCP